MVKNNEIHLYFLYIFHFEPFFKCVYINKNKFLKNSSYDNILIRKHHYGYLRKRKEKKVESNENLMFKLYFIF